MQTQLTAEQFTNLFKACLEEFNIAIASFLDHKEIDSYSDLWVKAIKKVVAKNHPEVDPLWICIIATMMDADMQYQGFAHEALEANNVLPEVYLNNRDFWF